MQEYTEVAIPAVALERLPVFPLPRAALLPGELLPLHVFEPRYREMTRDVLDGHGLLVVAQLDEAASSEPPGFLPIAGLGKVVASKELAGERYYIVLQGVARVDVSKERPQERLYREVQADLLSDNKSERVEMLTTLYSQVVVLCDRLAEQADVDSDKIRELPRSASDPGQCADLVAAAFVSDPEERQALLEALDPADRLETVIGHLSQHLVAMTGGPANLN